jgi:hypothetical protein
VDSDDAGSEEWVLHRRWPDALSGPFALRLVVRVVDGRLGVVGIELYGDRARPEDPRAVMAHTAVAADSEPIVELDLSGFPFPNALLDGTPRAISPTQVRQLKLGELLHEWKVDNRRTLEYLLRRHPEAQRSEWAAALMSPMQQLSARRSRAAHARAHYEKVAETYRAALEIGEHPTQRVAAAFQVSKSTAAKYVAHCRKPEVGLLPPTTRGRTAAQAVQAATAHPCADHN